MGSCPSCHGALGGCEDLGLASLSAAFLWTEEGEAWEWPMRHGFSWILRTHECFFITASAIFASSTAIS